MRTGGAGFTAPPVVPPMPAQKPLRSYDLSATPTIRSEPLDSVRKTPASPPLPPARSPSPPPIERSRPTPPPMESSPSGTDPAARRPEPPPEPPAAPIEEDAPAPSTIEAAGPAPGPPPPPEAPPARPTRKKGRRRKGKGEHKRAGGSQPRRKVGFVRRFFRSRLFRFGLLFLAFLFLLGAAAFLGGVWHYSKDLPSVDSLAVYEPPTVTRVTDSQGDLVGEFFEEQRYVVPLERIPKHVQDAFVAAEDAAFWEHAGLDYLGIVRAMIKNIQEGRMAQGASTITQQVARSFLLTREKKLERKIKEAILAARVERNFDKEHILFLYLNQIFLGHGAYGVQAAARLYFDKDISELTLAEGAIIAGLPQAPSNYSPNRNFSAAKERQRYVLTQMAKRGYITEEEADAAYAVELVFARKRDRNLDVAPYYVEHVRRYLVNTYSHDVVYNQGLRVVLPVDLELQAVANGAVKTGVRRSDKIMGYRGPLANHESEADRDATKQEIDRARTVELRPYDPAFELPEGPVDPVLVPPLTEGEIARGVVAEVSPKWALVDVGSHRGLLHVSEFTWCHNINPEVSFRYFLCKSLDDTLFTGDEIEVRVVNLDESWSKTLGRKWTGPTDYPRLAMEQPPVPESALLSVRVTDGAVLAMVGGSDYVSSEFNRATQARRQVGSTFKPLVYAAALDCEDAPFTPSSILVDAPIVEESRGVKGEVWTPGNAGGEYLGDTTFRRGLILSRNIVTLKILQRIGVGYLVEYVERFGFESELPRNLSVGLGTASVTMTEMARAYTVFPTLGDRRDLYFVSEVRDRHGNVLEQTTEGPLVEDVMDEETAYIMVNLMQDVVRAGTARKALVLGVPLAGKTGTTNDFKDAWFIGYTPELLTAAWVGLDEFKSMGKGQYGGDVALPIFVEYMHAALAKYPPGEYEKPDDVHFIKVDMETGLLAREGEPSTKVPYVKGTEPTTYAPEAGAVDTATFMSGEF